MKQPTADTYSASAVPVPLGTLVRLGPDDYAVVSCEPRGENFLIGLDIATMHASDIHGQRLSEIPTGSANTP